MTTPEIPKKHKAAVYDKPGSISTRIEEVDTPEPGPGQVLVRLTHSGVCHSDYSVMTNSWAALPNPTAAGQVGGHEGVGTVVKLGPGAEASAIKVGDRVGIKWISAVCGSCPACLEGHDGLCFNGQISGYYTPGTFQQYVLGPANYVTPIPDDVESAAAAPMLCGGVTVYAGLKRSGASPGEYVAIIGAGGGLGHLAVQIAARGMGMRVIGVDHSSKEKLVMESGAEKFFAFDTSKDLIADVKKASEGLGVKASLVLTANNTAYGQGFEFLRFGGTLVCIGIPEGDLVAVAGASPTAMIFGEKKIVGSAVGSRRDAIECLRMASRGVVKTHYRVEKMEKLSEVFEEMHAGKLQGRVVLDLAA